MIIYLEKSAAATSLALAVIFIFGAKFAGGKSGIAQVPLTHSLFNFVLLQQFDSGRRAGRKERERCPNHFVPRIY
jgi:hypothetical protein